MNFISETKIFVDTNGLVYAHDTTAGRKRDVAREAVLELWNTGFKKVAGNFSSNGQPVVGIAIVNPFET